MATHVMPKATPAEPQPAVPKHDNDWTKPAAMAIPEEGYFDSDRGITVPLPGTQRAMVSAPRKSLPGREHAIA
jgi:hypothetical protein